MGSNVREEIERGLKVTFDAGYDAGYAMGRREIWRFAFLAGAMGGMAFQLIRYATLWWLASR